MGKRKTHADFVKQLKLITSNIEVIGEYIKANEIIRVKCLKCNGEWEPIANSLLIGNGCPFVAQHRKKY